MIDSLNPNIKAMPEILVQYLPPRPSNLALVGEAPGEQEVFDNLPFVGQEGRYLTVLLNKAGIKRDDCYITNTVHIRPAGNDYTNLLPIDLEQGKNQLILDLIGWKRDGLKTIIAFGERALYMLTGKSGITKYRGTELPCSLVPGLKVCASLHPGYILRGNSEMEPVVVADLVKFRKRADDPNVFYPYRNIQVVRDAQDAINLLQSITNIETPVVVDIETSGPRMTAFGFATSPTQAYSIVKDLIHVPPVLRAISIFARSSTPKVFHNALFDTFHGLYYYHIYYNNIFFDTMLAQHCVYPSLPKSLAFCASLYTHEPYWKDEGKDTMLLISREGLVAEEVWQRLYIYNGKDTCLTYEIMNFLQEEIKSWGVEAVFKNDMNLVYPCLYAMRKGLLADCKAITAFAKKNERIIEVLDIIKRATVGEINLNSPTQLKQLLYDQWGFKPQMVKGRITTDSLALKRMERLPTPYKPHIGLITLLKKHLKERDFYSMQLDPDGYVRYSLKIHGTYTGRMASSTSITGSGSNFQNQPYAVRPFYIPEKGRIFLQADLSQSEARIVAALCGDKEWLEAFDTRDLHSETAAYLYKIPLSEVKKDTHRQIAKKIAHGTHYMMGPFQMADHVGCSFNEAKLLQSGYYKLRPGLRQWQNQVEARIRRDRFLRTVFGRVMQFMGPITDATVRDAIAAEPQSTSASYLNRGVINCWQTMPDYDFRLQVHDSMLLTTVDNPDVILSTITAIKANTELPITINDMTFRIPLEFEIGYDWGHLKKVTPSTVHDVWKGLQEGKHEVQ